MEILLQEVYQEESEFFEKMKLFLCELLNDNKFFELNY